MFISEFKLLPLQKSVFICSLKAATFVFMEMKERTIHSSHAFKILTGDVFVELKEIFLNGLLLWNGFCWSYLFITALDSWPCLCIQWGSSSYNSKSILRSTLRLFCLFYHQLLSCVFHGNYSIVFAHIELHPHSFLLNLPSTKMAINIRWGFDWSNEGPRFTACWLLGNNVAVNVH